MTDTPSVELTGARCVVTGGAGTIGSTVVDQLLEAGAGEVVVLDNFVRGRMANLAHARQLAAGAPGRLRVVDGDIRDRALLRELMGPGTDVLFHLAAIRITQCATEPRLALEV
ncbi:NAD-dependent epimerase/dehydratase family protein, partial [Streptacidiphilus griseoplanus]|uniref:NAD-dependent epimerase/dehydratase family protein n=1 Tax=Peterkaempfera griseoplana TaxID=66896 RepID=UPI0012FEF9E6